MIGYLTLHQVGLADHWSAHRWRIDDGLPDNNVTGIVQLEDGAMLFATSAGLTRFDGLHLTALNIDSEVAQSQMIRTMCGGPGGAIWLGFPRGLVIRQDTSGTRSFSAHRPLEIHPLSLQPDSRGGVWIGYTDGTAAHIERKLTLYGLSEGLLAGRSSRPCVDSKGKVWVLNGGRLMKFEDGHFKPSEVSEEIVALCAGADERLWLWTKTGLMKLSATGRSSISAPMPHDELSAEVNQLFEDREQHLWIGTALGDLLRLNGSQLEAVASLGRGITSLADDHEGNLWVGTMGNGVTQIRHRILGTLGNFDQIPDEPVRSLCIDKKRQVWMVTEQGQLWMRDEKGWRQQMLPLKPNGGKACCVGADPEGGVWVGTAGEKVFYFDGDSFQDTGLPKRMLSSAPQGWVRALLVDRDGSIWAAMGADLWHLQERRWTRAAGNPEGGYIQTLVQDREGQIWAGTSEGILVRVESGTLVDRTPRMFRKNVAIRGLFASDDGALWIGHGKDGLVRLKAGKAVPVGQQQGISQVGISQMNLDGARRLWCASERGIFYVPFDELNAVTDGRLKQVEQRRFGPSDELPSLQANRGFWPKSIVDSEGHIWFTTQTSVVLVDSTAAGKSDVPPPVTIEGLQVDGKAWPLPANGSVFTLPPRYRYAEIAFAAMSFASPENVRVRYRLDGLDRDWIESPADRRVRLTRLPVGDYIFRVIACNNDGIWNERGASIGIHVPPLFWQTLWFRILALLLFSLVVGMAVRAVLTGRWRRRVAALEREAAIERERARIARDMHDEIGASLTQIAISGKLASLEPADKAAVHIAAITSVARRVSASLDEIVWAVDPRNDRLPEMIGYLGQYVAEYLSAAGVDYELILPEELPRRAMGAESRHHLFLAVKEALHNVIKHSGAHTVRFFVETKQEGLHITVADDGHGFEGDGLRHGSDGLRNMQDRMRDIGGTCEIFSQVGKGTSITFNLGWSSASDK